MFSERENCTNMNTMRGARASQTSAQGTVQCRTLAGARAHQTSAQGAALAPDSCGHDGEW